MLFQSVYFSVWLQVGLQLSDKLFLTDSLGFVRHLEESGSDVTTDTPRLEFPGIDNQLGSNLMISFIQNQRLINSTTYKKDSLSAASFQVHTLLLKWTRFITCVRWQVLFCFEFHNRSLDGENYFKNFQKNTQRHKASFSPKYFLSYLTKNVRSVQHNFKKWSFLQKPTSK